MSVPFKPGLERDRELTPSVTTGAGLLIKGGASSFLFGAAERFLGPEPMTPSPIRNPEDGSRLHMDGVYRDDHRVLEERTTLGQTPPARRQVTGDIGARESTPLAGEKWLSSLARDMICDACHLGDFFHRTPWLPARRG
jgi:hypothetical protein